jgi:hypothetical protein
LKITRPSKTKTVERSVETDEGSIWELLLFTVFFVVVFSAVARADEASIQQALPSAKAASPYKLGATVLIETASVQNDADRTAYSGVYRLDLSLAHEPSSISLLSRTEYERQYTYQNDDGTDGQLSNPLFGITKSFKKGKGLPSRSFFDKAAIGLRGSLPANRLAQKQTFQGAIGPMAAVAKSIGRVDLQQTLQYSRRAFEYEMGNDGAVNSPDVYRGVSEITYNFTDSFAFGVVVLYDYAVSFQGVGKSSYLSILSLDYKVLESLTASIGVSTQKGTLEADGQTNRVLLYDGSAASTFIDLVFTL